MVGKRKGGVKSGMEGDGNMTALRATRRNLPQHHRGPELSPRNTRRANSTFILSDLQIQICAAPRPFRSPAPLFFLFRTRLSTTSFPSSGPFRAPSHEIPSKPLYILRNNHKPALHPSPSLNIRRHIQPSLVLSPPLSRSPKFPWHSPCLFRCS
jgi:hypothetical protein